MTKIIPLTLLLLLAACQDQAADQQTPTTSQDRTALIQEFDDNTEMYTNAIKNLTPDQWTFRESEGRWSIAEVVEHVVDAEVRILESVREMLETESLDAMPRDMQVEMDAKVSSILRDRSGGGAQSPESLIPNMRFASAADGLAAFGETRAATIEFLKSAPDTFRNHFTEALGMSMDAHQRMLYGSGHAYRHFEQIEQVFDHPDFPA